MSPSAISRTLEIHLGVWRARSFVTTLLVSDSVGWAGPVVLSCNELVLGYSSIRAYTIYAFEQVIVVVVGCPILAVVIVLDVY